MIRVPKLPNRFSQNSVKYTNTKLCQLILDIRLVLFIQLPTWRTAVTYTGGADKSLAQPTSRYILFDGENISFDASLVIYIKSTNIPPIVIINRIYETQNLL
jgi:hypothetical protein